MRTIEDFMQISPMPSYSQKIFRPVHYLICIYLALSCGAPSKFDGAMSIFANVLLVILVILSMPILFEFIVRRILLLFLPIVIMPIVISMFNDNINIIYILFIFKSFLLPFLFVIFVRNIEGVKQYAISILIGAFIMSGLIFMVLPDIYLIGNRNGICIRLLMGLFASLLLICLSSKIRNKIALIYIPIFFFVVFLLGARGIFLSGLCTISVFILLIGKLDLPSITIRLITFVGSCGLLIFVFYEKLITFPIVYRLYGLFGLNYYNGILGKMGLANLRGQDRLDIYSDVWNLFLQNPWTGYGFVSFDNYSNFVYTHSVYLELLFVGGFLSLGFYIILIFYSIYYHVRYYIHCSISIKSYSVAVLSIISGLLVYGAFYPLIYAQLFWFFLLLGSPQFRYLAEFTDNSAQTKSRNVTKCFSVNHSARSVA